jgi:hypothetical protein
MLTNIEKVTLVDLACGHIPMTSERYIAARRAVLALAELLRR